MATLTRVHNPRSARPSTLSALHSPNFRLYFAGQLISISGTWMQNIAQGFLVFELTHSALWLGIVACASGLPVVLMAPIGGVIVERVPRRRLLIFTQTSQMILAFVLTWLTYNGTVQVWHVVWLSFLLGVTNAIDIPARQTFVVEMVGHEDMYSGIALNSILNNLGRILGPAAAGLALVQFGAAWCFFLNGLTFLAVLISLVLMRVPYAITFLNNVSPMRQLREGMSYARRDPLVLSLLLLCVVSGLFVIPIIQMLPAFADAVLRSPDVGYADLSVGQGIGSVIAAMIFSWFAYRLGYGKLLMGAFALAAATSVWLAMQDSILLASLIMGVVGAFMVSQFIALNTFLQTVVPDGYRGRVMGLYTLALLGLTPFGALALGWLANIIGTAQAIALFGIASGVLAGLIFVRWPVLLGQRRSSEPEVVPKIAIDKAA